MNPSLSEAGEDHSFLCSRGFLTSPACGEVDALEERGGWGNASTGAGVRGESPHPDPPPQAGEGESPQHPIQQRQADDHRRRDQGVTDAAKQRLAGAAEQGGAESDADGVDRADQQREPDGV